MKAKVDEEPLHTGHRVTGTLPGGKLIVHIILTGYGYILKQLVAEWWWWCLGGAEVIP